MPLLGAVEAGEYGDAALGVDEGEIDRDDTLCSGTRITGGVSRAVFSKLDPVRGDEG